MRTRSSDRLEAPNRVAQASRLCMGGSGLLVALTAIFGFDAVAEETHTCTLSGQVIHVVSKEPVQGVTVGLGYFENFGKEQKRLVRPYGTPPSQFETKSAADGTFSLSGIEPGERLLLVRDETMAAVEGEILYKLGPGEHRAGTTLYVAEGASISGTVYNDGYYHGVGGVVVQAYRFDGNDWGRAYASTSTADGAFHLGGLPAGIYEIGSSPEDGFEQTSLLFYGESGIQSRGGYREGLALRWDTHYAPYEFTVKEGVLVRGVVVDESGAPVADAAVGTFNGCVLTSDVYTGPDGSFALWGWERDSMPKLMAHKDGMFTEWIRSDTSVREYGPIQLTLRPGATLTVRVTDAQGIVAPWLGNLDAFIKHEEAPESSDLKGFQSAGWLTDFAPIVRYQGFDDNAFMWATPNDTGRIVFAGIPPGTYQIGVADRQSETVEPYVQEDPLSLSFGERQVVDLTYPEPEARDWNPTKGRVVDERGQPIVDAILTPTSFLDNRENQFVPEWVLPQPPRSRYSTRTGANGSFTYLPREVEEGYHPRRKMEHSVDIRVEAPVFLARSVAVEAGASDVTITLLKSGVLSGRVLDEATGAPLAKFDIGTYVNRYTGDGKAMEQIPIEDVIVDYGPDGKFTLSGIEEPVFMIAVNAAGYVPLIDPFFFDEGLREADIELHLERSGAVDATVVDARGYPIPGAAILLHREMPKRFVDTIDREDSRFRRSLAKLDVEQQLRTNDFGAANIDFGASEQVDMDVISQYTPYRNHVSPQEIRSESLRIVVPDGGVMTGRVTQGGKPLAKREFWLEFSLWHEKDPYKIGEYVVADDDGHYRLEGLAFGTHSVTCEPAYDVEPDFSQTLVREFQVVPGEDTELDFDFLSEDTRLVGQVAIREGESPPNVEVYWPWWEGGYFSQYLKVAEDGTFQVYGMPAQPIKLLAYSETSERFAVVNLQIGETTEVNLGTGLGSDLSGRVVRNGIDGPLLIYAVSGGLKDTGTNTFSSPQYCDRDYVGLRVEDDRFQFEHIPKGPLTLLCFAALDSGMNPARPLNLLAKTEVEIGTRDSTEFELRLDAAR